MFCFSQFFLFYVYSNYIYTWKTNFQVPYFPDIHFIKMKYRFMFFNTFFFFFFIKLTRYRKVNFSLNKLFLEIEYNFYAVNLTFLFFTFYFNVFDTHTIHITK